MPVVWAPLNFGEIGKKAKNGNYFDNEESEREIKERDERKRKKPRAIQKIK